MCTEALKTAKVARVVASPDNGERAEWRRGRHKDSTLSLVVVSYLEEHSVKTALVTIDVRASPRRFP